MQVVVEVISCCATCQQQVGELLDLQQDIMRA